MTPDDQKELTRLRWQESRTQKLAERWHAEASPHSEKSACAQELDAVLKKQRPAFAILAPALVFYIAIILTIALAVCILRH